MPSAHLPRRARVSSGRHTRVWLPDRAPGPCSWTVLLDRTWQAGCVVEMDAAEFEQAVGDALDAVPPELMRLLDNVVFFIEDEPPSEHPQLFRVFVATPLHL